LVWVSRAAKPLHLIPTVFLSKERGPPPRAIDAFGKVKKR